jgi:hypothetical protein
MHMQLQALNAHRRSCQGLTEAELLLYTETFKYDGVAVAAVSDSPKATTATDNNSSSSTNSSNDASTAAAAAVEEGRSSSIASVASIASAVRHNSGARHQSECVICLSDFETGEQIRRLVSNLPTLRSKHFYMYTSTVSSVTARVPILNIAHL